MKRILRRTDRKLLTNILSKYEEDNHDAVASIVELLAADKHLVICKKNLTVHAK